LKTAAKFLCVKTVGAKF